MGHERECVSWQPRYSVTFCQRFDDCHHIHLVQIISTIKSNRKELKLEMKDPSIKKSISDLINMTLVRI